jgi:hypothetical protein
VEVAYVLLEIGQAIQYLHGHRIAHRDIKPENIVMAFVRNVLLRESQRSVTLAGQQRFSTQERPTAAPLTTLRLKSSRERSTARVLTYGVWEFLRLNFLQGEFPSNMKIGNK